MVIPFSVVTYYIIVGTYVLCEQYPGGSLGGSTAGRMRISGILLPDCASAFQGGHRGYRSVGGGSPVERLLQCVDLSAQSGLTAAADRTEKYPDQQPDDEFHADRCGSYRSSADGGSDQICSYCSIFRADYVYVSSGAEIFQSGRYAWITERLRSLSVSGIS